MLFEGCAGRHPLHVRQLALLSAANKLLVVTSCGKGVLPEKQKELLAAVRLHSCAVISAKRVVAWYHLGGRRMITIPHCHVPGERDPKEAGVQARAEQAGRLPVAARLAVDAARDRRDRAAHPGRGGPRRRVGRQDGHRCRQVVRDDEARRGPAAGHQGAHIAGRDGRATAVRQAGVHRAAAV
eukprot:5009781-Prymnesium_polylepis.1